MTPRDLRRFWAKVRKANGCWEWTGHRQAQANGIWHGRFRLNGKILKAHRVAWTMEHGDIPPWMAICHHCDNPGCVRVSHLFLSTPSGNQMDKMRKGRHRVAHGEEYARAKLTAEAVREIRRGRAAGVPLRLLAERFGVTTTTAHDAAVGRNWGWLDGIGGGRQRPNRTRFRHVSRGTSEGGRCRNRTCGLRLRRTTMPERSL